MNLGEQLQKLREEKKMSREELAGEMNVSRQAVYK
ncbi:helix-turn-helix transcriptional regulator [Priestia megaterium]|nr:helix-turn-helix transcriptional regulator [Priestia megaterium]WJD79541.1 helix-turn-helix transcriptional regulator [Priestia megaterium]